MGSEFTEPTDYSTFVKGDQSIVTETAPLTDKAYLTSREAAAYTGFSEIYFRKARSKAAATNGIPYPPYIRVGRSIRYAKRDLDIWMNQFRVEPGDLG